VSSAWSVKVVIKKFSVEKSQLSFETPACQNISRGTELNKQLQDNGKKGISRCKEDFMCDFEWQ
jgi:hypothetical protein